MESKARSTDKVNATIERFSGFGEGAAGGGTFIFEAYDKDGNLKWRDEAKNLTTNVGRQDMNTKYFTGTSYTAGWYIGLVNNSPTPSYDVTDTMASHAGWVETTDYSGTDRITADFGTATSADPSVIANNTAFISFENATISASFTARGALIYKSGSGNPAICVLDFGSDKTSTATFTVTFPTASSTDALIRLS